MVKLYNTLSRQIEKIEPFKKGKIGLYACGLTVYDYTHLGHLRKYTMDDVLVRTLRHDGFEVNHVQNVTDVGHLASDADTGEDKLEKGAKKYKSSVWDIAKKFEEYFYRSMDLMGNERPNVICRATEHVEDQLRMVVELEKKGFTYLIKGDGVYFDTSKFADYGALARLNLNQQKEGARVAKIEGKKNPTDFALWKFEREGENRAMVWQSPWHERSFPGWHIECSAMSVKYLGDQFEIHTGGIDHIPVHHVNEIAQSEAATGRKPFVKYWVHHNFLQVEGEKMSKSLGNFFTIDDVLEKGFEPMALRLLFLSSHYRSEMNFTWDNLQGVQKSWDRLKDLIRDIKVQNQPDDQEVESSSAAAVREMRDRFFALIRDDLKTPEALAVMWEVVKSDLLETEKYQLLLEFDQVLGLGLSKIKKLPKKIVEIPEKVTKLVEKRAVAREHKNWQESDEIRQQIKKLGWKVTDQGREQQVSKI